MKELRGRTAVVTGAGSGIGLGLARRFVEEGMAVTLADVQDDALAAAVEELSAAGGRVIGVRTDVSSADAVEELARRTVEAFGGVHVLCNNAGVESGGLFADIPLATWKWVLDVNLFGVINGCHTFLPLLREQPEAHIVNTSSLAGVSAGAPTLAPYVASKFAVLGISESLQSELRSHGESIGVSVLLPGPVRTNLTRAERNRPQGVPTTNDTPDRKQVISDLEAGAARDGLEPSEVAQLVVDAILGEQFYIMTHPERTLGAVKNRHEWMLTGDSPGVRRPGT